MQIADAHNDLLMYANSIKLVHNYLEFAKYNKVVKVFTAYYVAQKQEFQDFDTLFLDIINKFNLLKDYPDLIYKTFENIGFVNDKCKLKKLIDLHPFCVTLTWNHTNCLGGGAKESGGLSEWGKEVVAELIKNNIIIDCAHLNEQSFIDLMEFGEPLFCSHTASRELYNIPRNLNKNQLRVIANSKGFVGLSLYNTLLGEHKANFDLIYAHLDSMLENAGENTVGFGTDFNSTGEENPQGLKDYQGFGELYDFLLKYYCTSTLDKVFSKNLLSFIKRVEDK